ncbi:MAG TPA: BadF/BadG/BcrA/BcrD ATPase family protein [Bryobacteraceae bacterium]|jgi:N-acetylglucosamine kinase-like BadF-type ATPase|nr:BadF/BadG/BcrA/BcrD ATPase family protein [Bryobacteraceae bacterium]
MTKDRLYLGIDGGQSSTTALVAGESGRIIGEGRGGPCNHVAAAERQAKFLRTIGACIAEACQPAGLDAATVSFAAACFGFSGGAEDKELSLRQLVRSDKYKFTHDAEIALTGALAGDPGIIVIAGTGSMAFGRNAFGTTARAGGWGYLFGDEGGAFDLARRALRAALRFEEGWGVHTNLRNLLLQAAGAPDANTLMHGFYNHFDRVAIASLAPLVTQAAEQGDHAALEIVDDACRALVWFVHGVHRHLFPAGESVPVACIGGVFRSALLRDAFAREVRTTLACHARAPLWGPAAGALLEAFRLDGNPNTPSGVPEFEK